MIRKESKAWLLLAELVDKLFQSKMTQYQVGYCPVVLYLCWFIDRNNESLKFMDAPDFTRLVAQKTRDAMYARIREDLAFTDGQMACRGAYDESSFDERPDNNRARILACLMFAHEAASEGR